MATESNTEIVSGGYHNDYHAGTVHEFISDESITLWSPVILVAAGSGEDLPRVEPTNSANNPDVIGIAIGGEKCDGTSAATAAGEKVKVACVGVICKLRVDGTAAAIAIGDLLVTTTTDGMAAKGDIEPATNSVAAIIAANIALSAAFAKALKASTTLADIIPVMVIQTRGDSI